MAKRTIEFEVDVPAGFEIEVRCPKKGETFLRFTDALNIYSPITAGRDFTSDIHPVLVPIWTPPSWLKPGWIAMDENGTWWWYAIEPTRGLSAWYGVGQCRLTPATNFNPPRCDDWTTSKMQIGA